jgi:exo-beta-1,3-glucanase (GH17 family)
MRTIVSPEEFLNADVRSDNASGHAQALHSTGQVPPPPSRAQQPYPSRQAYLPQTAGGYGYDQGYDSTPNLAAPGPAVSRGNSRSPSRSPHSYASGEVYDDPYQGLSTAGRGVNHNFGVVNPLEIDDDGDDGLNYSKRSQRNSMLSSSNSDRGARSGLAASAAVGGAAAGNNAASGAAGKSGLRNGGGYYDPPSAEKTSAWSTTHQEEEKIRSKKKKWAIILLIVVVAVGAIVGGIVGSFATGKSGNDVKGQSAKDDQETNGDLDKNSSQIKELLNNPNLHKVFPGMDYTPFNTQYPDCIHDPPSQNNVTRDVAVLSQLTNKIRLYGTDCNQTQMVIEAIRRLDLEDTVKIWMGVWQDKNTTTNERQLAQMWDILDEYKDNHFEGVIVANEILFREEMSLTTLGSLLDEVRTNLTAKGMEGLHVATSDLGDDWTPGLAASSDYIMANIHPFFAGVEATNAASWTMTFWEGQNKPMWKKEKSRNVISETGWPSGGGRKCPIEDPKCARGSVAGIDEMNQFMDDWVCQALKNGTEYFWFEAFDEPWKVRYNEDGKEWEDKWGLMDLERNLKDGIKIPDCGGMTVDNAKSSR